MHLKKTLRVEEEISGKIVKSLGFDPESPTMIENPGYFLAFKQMCKKLSSNFRKFLKFWIMQLICLDKNIENFSSFGGSAHPQPPV